MRFCVHTVAQAARHMAARSMPSHQSLTGNYTQRHASSAVSFRRFSIAVRLAIRCVAREIPAADSDSDVHDALGHAAAVLESFSALLRSDHWKTVRSSPDVATNLLDIIAELYLLLEHSHSRPLLTDSLLADLEGEEASLAATTDQRTWNVSFKDDSQNSELKRRERAHKMRKAVGSLRTRYGNVAFKYSSDH